MKAGNKKFYITTPLYYVNAAPHIGHSYTQIATDTLTRFHRLLGEEVFFMTGTDEHGEKIEKATIDGGFAPGNEKEFVDGIIPKFKKLWEDLDIEYDYFIRTTDDYHKRTVQHILTTLYEKKDIYKGEYDGWFCIPCEMFWSDTQAVDGNCPDCKRKLEKIKENNYFFKISKYQKWLIDHIDNNPGFIMPDYRKNEVLSFLKNNELNDLCISRSKKRLKWGIELPFDKEYVTYVWVDALINYISGIGFLDDKERFKSLWPADLHIIGKDILRHHAVYWPIMLHASGIELPRTIFAHGWWTIKGSKMSKSKGNIVDPYYVVGKYGVDPYRYFLLREMPFGLDGGFSEEALIGRFNSDLANDLGNLLNRTLTMVEKCYEGKVPEPVDSGQWTVDREACESMAKKIKEAMSVLNFSEALTVIWEFVNKANKSIEVKAPWKLIKEGKIDEHKSFIYELLESLRIIVIAIYPFMPKTAQNMWAQLGLKDLNKASFDHIKRYGLMPPGTVINKGAPLFPRIKK
ncbi:MAG: methionine--tRNA ligase [Candidatus Omnitrophota bacterium]